MKNEPTLLTESQITQVSAGLGWKTALFILEIPHIIMGIREFTNYTVDLLNKGCDDIDENDHFTQGLCSLYNTI